MPYFYFDESLQTRAQFIVGAYVYGPDAEVGVSSAIERVGLTPGVDEFKSSARMSEHPEQALLRDELFEIIRGYRIAILVAPLAERPNLGRLALEGLNQVALANGLVGTVGLEAALDEGLFSSSQEAGRAIEAASAHGYCFVRPEQDSRQVKGLQLADLVAHTAGIVLLDSLGLVTKTVKAGHNSGYDEDLEIDLGFELWAGLRYQFFNSGPVDDRSDQEEIFRGALVKVGLNGLLHLPARTNYEPRRRSDSVNATWDASTEPATCRQRPTSGTPTTICSGTPIDAVQPGVGGDLVITYTNSIEDLNPSDLSGFLTHWDFEPPAGTLFEILIGSTEVILAPRG